MSDQLPQQPQFQNQDNALIWAELKVIGRQTEEIKKTLNVINGRVRESEVHAAVLDERWQAHFKLHDDVKRNGFLGDLISSIIAVIVTVLGALGYNAVK